MKTIKQMILYMTSKQASRWIFGSLTVGGLRKKKKIDLITSYLSNLYQ